MVNGEGKGRLVAARVFAEKEGLPTATVPIFAKKKILKEGVGGKGEKKAAVNRMRADVQIAVAGDF